MVPCFAEPVAEAVPAGSHPSPFGSHNLESGYPLQLEDARLLPSDTQTFSIVFGVPDLLDEYHREYMDIEVHQGITDRWQVSFTGSLDNVRGNSDGNTAVEGIFLLRPNRPGRASYGAKLQFDLGSTNDNLRATLMGIASRDVGGLTLHFNGYLRLQEQEGTAVRQEVSGATFGVSSPVRFLAGTSAETPATAIIALGWEESLLRARKDALQLDAGLRVPTGDGWLWYIGVGTDLEKQIDQERPVRVIGGVSWDITS